MKTHPYHNTTDLRAEDLTSATSDAVRQNDLVMDLFRANPTALLTPEEVHSALFDARTPLTSTRRAITTLTNQGRLEKTGTWKKSSYDRKTYCWGLPRLPGPPPSSG